MHIVFWVIVGVVAGALAKMAVPGPVDVSRELRALTDVIAAYVDHHRTT